jgi:hypothetical protein
MIAIARRGNNQNSAHEKEQSTRRPRPQLRQFFMSQLSDLPKTNYYSIILKVLTSEDLIQPSNKFIKTDQMLRAIF